MWAPTTEDLERGEALHVALSSGVKTFDASEQDEGNGDNEKM
jgi:hypothetical protein